MQILAGSRPLKTGNRHSRFAESVARANDCPAVCVPGVTRPPCAPWLFLLLFRCARLFQFSRLSRVDDVGVPFARMWAVYFTFGFPGGLQVCGSITILCRSRDLSIDLELKVYSIWLLCIQCLTTQIIRRSQLFIIHLELLVSRLEL